MAYHRLFPVLPILLWLVAVAHAAAFPATTHALDFTTIRLGDVGNTGRTVLVVAGIQGDEPGGFSAASLLATRYEIVSGSVWVVPNLNFPSIIQRSRGLHGDMNRKFATLDRRDPEFPTVTRIQSLIRDEAVGLVLNLHDGSGYYRPTHESDLANPRRWGQSVIIDQDTMPGNPWLGALGREAQSVCDAVNGKLVRPLHALHVHNTHTAEGDREMEKSLSYYAMRSGKAAFGLEASKEFSVSTRAYYHLRMIEHFLKLAGVRFRRDFELTVNGVEEALRTNLGVAFAANRVFLPLEDVRPAVNLLPLPRDAASRALISKPIMAVLPCKGQADRLCIHYGNRTITVVQPDWHELDTSLDGVDALVDGREESVPFGHVVRVEQAIRVRPNEGYRLNAIGADRAPQGRDEAGFDLRLRDFTPRFSIDRQGRVYRMEVYRGKRFCGMFLVQFADKGTATAGTAGTHAGARKPAPMLPSADGPESRLGF